MKHHVLIASDQFEDRQIERIGETLGAWATWERVAQSLPEVELREKLNRATVVIGWADGRILAESPVRYYFCGSAGFDAYLRTGLEAREGFVMTSARHAMSAPLAEHVMAMMFALARLLPAHFKDQLDRHWQRRWHYRELAGSTVCVVGLGGMGTELARRCAGLGMNVIGVRKRAGKPHSIVERVHASTSLAEAVAEADHVAAVVPGGRATDRLFDREVFAAMRPGACFYTASRGSVTDEAALIAALESGHLGGAGLDVVEREPLSKESPLWAMPNVIITPHCAGLSAKLNDRLCDLFIENLRRLKGGEPLLNVVNLTENRPQDE